MHRSGTSVAARALKVLGVSLGENLMGADQFNIKGYYEDLDIFRLNESILNLLGCQWDSLVLPGEDILHQLSSNQYFTEAVELLATKLKTTSLFGMKDPRFSVLLPFWQLVFKQLKVDVSYVIVFRHPQAVVYSLSARNQGLPEKYYWLWIINLIRSLTYTGRSERFLADYEGMLREPEKFLDHLARRLNLSVSKDQLNDYIGHFLDQNLDHSGRRDLDEMAENDGPPLAMEIYRTIKKLLKER